MRLSIFQAASRRAGPSVHILPPILFWAGLLLCGPARAEGPAPLTLDALLSELARRSPELQVRRAEIRAAQERPAQARAFSDPEISAELWQVPTGLGQVPLMFTLRQPIPWPGKLRARAASMEPEIARARAESGSAGRGLRLEAARAYYDYRLAIRSIEVLGQNRQLLSTVVDSVDIRYRVGRAELAELLKVQQELATLATTLIDLERQRELAATVINTLLALPADHPIGEPVTVPVVRPLPSPEALTALALGRRPEIQAVRASLIQAQARVREARKERAPDLAAWAGYMTMLRGGENTFTLGVQTTIPSFSLVRSNAAAREALAGTGARQAALSQAEARVRGDVREALLRLDTAQRHIRLSVETLIPLSERTVEAAQASYQSGRTSIVLLLDAIRALIDQRVQYEQFLAEYGQRLAEVEAAVGGPLPTEAP